MSIIRVGLAETKNFAEGYDAIFGKKTEAKEAEPKPATTKDAAPKKAGKKGKKK